MSRPEVPRSDRVGSREQHVGGGIVNAMSIDVEEHFQANVFDDVVDRATWPTLESRVLANTTRMLDLFAEHRVHGTFFVLGWVAERFPEIAKRVVADGHEIASHGHGHRLIYEQTPEEFRADVRRAKAVLEDQTGRAVAGYRAPSYSVVEATLWALDVLAEEGYRYDASIYPIRHDRYGIPTAPRHLHRRTQVAGEIVEVPGSTVRVAGANLPVGGGGYFRLLPYAWTRWGLRHLNGREQRPAVFYLHPWEIDPQQPRLGVGFLSRVRHYRHLDRTEARLRRLLSDFRFDTVGRLVDDLARAA